MLTLQAFQLWFKFLFEIKFFWANFNLSAKQTQYGWYMFKPHNTFVFYSLSIWVSALCLCFIYWIKPRNTPLGTRKSYHNPVILNVCDYIFKFLINKYYDHFCFVSSFDPLIVIARNGTFSPKPYPVSLKTSTCTPSSVTMEQCFWSGR